MRHFKTRVRKAFVKGADGNKQLLSYVGDIIFSVQRMPCQRNGVRKSVRVCIMGDVLVVVPRLISHCDFHVP